jgi:hypothetical protein
MSVVDSITLHVPRAGVDKPSVSGGMHVGAILHFDGIRRTLGQSPKLSLNVVLGYKGLSETPS